MTREERENAIDIIQSILNKYEEDECLVTEITIGDEDIEALKLAIKALEQQPEDAISRAEAVRVASGYCHPSNIAEELAKLPAVQPIRPKGYWIPVSEGMPNEFADVICCTEAKEMFIATYLGKMNDGTDCFDDHDGMMWEGDIIAWMPLPEPYEP